MKVFTFLKKKILLFMIIGIILLIITMTFGKSSDYNIEYSTYNTEDDGCKALYDLTKRFSTNVVDRHLKKSKMLNRGGMLVAIKPNSMSLFNEKFEQENLINWVKKGNIFFIIDSKIVFEQSRIFKEIIKVNDSEVVEYRLGEGKVYFYDGINNITNSKIKSYTEAINVLEVFDKHKDKEILFDEYYHGLGKQNLNFFDTLNGMQFTIVIQLALAIMIFMIYKAKRFGKPMPIMKHKKRLENENVYALAGIYRRSKSYSLVLQAYAENLKKDLKSSFDISIDGTDEELYSVLKQKKSAEEVLDILNLCDQKTRSNNLDIVSLTMLSKKIERIRRELK